MRGFSIAAQTSKSARTGARSKACASSATADRARPTPMSSCGPGGWVERRAGLCRRLVRGLKTVSRIDLAGGAQRAFPSSYELLEFADEADLDQLERRIRRPDDLAIGSAHPQGGNPMSEDPRAGRGRLGLTRPRIREPLRRRLERLPPQHLGQLPGHGHGDGAYAATHVAA